VRDELVVPPAGGGATGEGHDEQAVADQAHYVGTHGIADLGLDEVPPPGGNLRYSMSGILAGSSYRLLPA